MSQITSEAPSETGKDSGHPPADEGEHASSGEHAHGDHGGDGHGHGHYPFLAHHFDTPGQQFDAGKLGIWLFLFGREYRSRPVLPVGEPEIKELLEAHAS